VERAFRERSKPYARVPCVARIKHEHAVADHGAIVTVERGFVLALQARDPKLVFFTRAATWARRRLLRNQPQWYTGIGEREHARDRFLRRGSLRQHPRDRYVTPDVRNARKSRRHRFADRG